jgi:alcohol dehydrogenase
MKQSMLAAVYCGNGKIELQNRPVPILLHSRDAIVRVTRSAICTSDLHIRNGAVPRTVPGVILGHEFVGEVISVGTGITSLYPGERVAANCETFCGECWYCRHGYVNNCVQGGWELGCRIDGCQAEYVRVPYADTGLTKIPESVTDEDALFLGDILSSADWAAGLCEIHPGDSIVVIGAGPVGLCAAECAKQRGAGMVISIDKDPHRLEVALKNGLADVVLNPAFCMVEEEVRAHSYGRGADGVIEAAGGEDTFELAWKLARPNGIVALAAMYENPQVLPLPDMYGKNLIFKAGGVDACRCSELMGLIQEQKLRTDFLITHRAPLENILEGYSVFEQKSDHCIKWVVTPPCH